VDVVVGLEGINVIIRELDARQRGSVNHGSHQDCICWEGWVVVKGTMTGNVHEALDQAVLMLDGTALTNSLLLGTSKGKLGLAKCYLNVVWRWGTYASSSSAGASGFRVT
jgi:hypothetical protein